MNIGRISTKRKNETLIKIGEKYGKTGPQVALRYLMELGVIAGCNQKNNQNADDLFKDEIEVCMGMLYFELKSIEPFKGRGKVEEKY